MLDSRDEIDQVTVYTFDGKGQTHQNNVLVRRYRSPSIFSFEVLNTYAYFKLKSKLVQDEIDVIHSYNMRLHPIVGHLSETLGIPSVATLNSYAFIPFSKLDIPVNNLLDWYKRISWTTSGRILRNRMCHVDVFIAISSAVGEIYRRAIFSDQRIEVVPNMCEPHLFDTGSSSDSVKIPENRMFDILYVGSLRETKGVEYLIRAITYLPDEYQVTIAGGGSNESELRQLADQFGVADRVTFMGHVPHDRIEELYAEADLFVHPGIWPEPFGRTILEAMQFGLPVVATNIGGPAEVIPQDRCLCTPRDPEDLAETIRDIQPDTDRLGRENRRYVHKNYSPSVVAPQIIEVYKSICK
jgi:glycosyltransferase involved in cell wall biosynthesis